MAPGSKSQGGTSHQVINPATEAPCAEIMLGSAADVDAAVQAARTAFDSFSQTSVETRVALLEAILAEYKNRGADIAAAIAEEMGCPISFAQTAQVGTGVGHFMAAIKALKEFEFSETVGQSLVVHEPIGVVALITPWNWPMNQIVAKVAPALAAGNSMILKPSEEAPTCAAILAEVLDKAGVPKGVFNLINGDGPGVGTALAQHPGIDMVSFTGSTRAGIMVAKKRRRYGQAGPSGTRRQIAVGGARGCGPVEGGARHADERADEFGAKLHRPHPPAGPQEPA